MTNTSRIPQYHLYGEDIDGSPFNFFHIETLAARSAENQWTISPHSHRHLYQVLFLETGGGQVIIEDNASDLAPPMLIFFSPNVVHGLAFDPGSRGHIISFTEDVLSRTGSGGQSLNLLNSLGDCGLSDLSSDPDRCSRIGEMFAQLTREHVRKAKRQHLALRAWLELLLVELSRIQAHDSQGSGLLHARAQQTVNRFRELAEDGCRTNRKLPEYAENLGITVDSLNEHCKTITGQTAGQLLRARVLTEAKRTLLFTDRSVNEISYDLGFSDPSYFTRFFKKAVGQTPHRFRQDNRLD